MVNKYEQYCIDESKYFLERATEAMEACKIDPLKYYEESSKHYKNICKLFPFMVMIQCNESLQSSRETGGSVSDTLSSDSISEGSYAPATPPGH